MAHLFIIARYPFRSHSEGRIPTESGMDFLSARLSFGHMRLLSFFLVSRKAGYLLKLGLYLLVAHVSYVSLRVLSFIYHSEGRIPIPIFHRGVNWWADDSNIFSGSSDCCIYELDSSGSSICCSCELDAFVLVRWMCA